VTPTDPLGFRALERDAVGTLHRPRQPLLHVVAQLEVDDELGRLGALRTQVGMPLRGRGAVLKPAAASRGVAAQLSGDRRRRPIEPARDLRECHYDTTVYAIECVLLATIVVSFGLAGVIVRLRLTRPDFSVGRPIAFGIGVRLLAIAGLSISGLGSALSSGDEIGFVQGAREVAASRFDSGLWFPSQSYRLHELVFALQIKLGDFPEVALRVTQVGIAMLGIILIVAAIYDLAGARAARLGAWVLAFEPASIFFNSILHREPLLVLASGLDPMAWLPAPAG